MKLREKALFTVLGLSMFVVSGGIACSYDDAAIIGQVLAIVFGALVFVTAGAVACIYSNSRIAKRKATQSLSQTNTKE